MNRKVWNVILLIGLAASLTQAQNRQVRPVSAPRRLALVIGNDAYPDKRLSNAVNDARSMRDALTSAGFTVDLLTDRSLQQLELGIDQFVASVRPGDVALVFYSGHGIQVQDQNYLIPVDFIARTAIDAKYKSYPVQRVIDNLELAGVSIQIIILDACRDNPYRSMRGAGGGLASMNAGRGVYIALATAPGKTASDNPNGRNGLFTGELINVIRQKGLSIDQIFNQTRAKVSSLSGGDQIPWSTSSMVGEFYFVASGGPNSNPTPPITDPVPDPAKEAWERAKSSGNKAMLQAIIQEFPDSPYARLAKVELAGLAAAVTPGNSGRPPGPDVPPKEDPGANQKNVGPDREQTAAAIDRKFQSWAASWMMDRYINGSARIDDMKCGAKDCTASGTFSFVRVGARHQIAFQVGIVATGADTYSLGRLCYNDATTNMRDCTN